MAAVANALTTSKGRLYDDEEEDLLDLGTDFGISGFSEDGFCVLGISSVTVPEVVADLGGSVGGVEEGGGEEEEEGGSFAGVEN